MITTLVPRARRVAAVIAAAVAVAGLAACGGPASLDAVGPGADTGPDADAPRPTVAVDPALLAAFPDAIEQSGVLRVGVSPNFAPLNFKRDDGSLTGAETELTEALGQRAGLRIEFVETNFAGLLSGLAADRFDTVISGVTDTLAREQEFTFVNFSQVGKNLLIRASDAETVRGYGDLCGRTMGVTVGTTYADELAELSRTECEATGGPAIVVQTFDTGNDVKQAIATSRVDGTYGAVASNSYASTLSEGELVTTGEVLDRNFSGALVPKDDTELVEALHATLQSLTADGTTRAVLERWQLGDEVLPEVQINGATE